MVKYLEKNSDLFDEIAQGNYLVDFYADWCGPCKMLGSILEEIDYIDIIKVNIDEHLELASKLGIISIPTILFCKDGLIMQKEIGYRTPEEIKDIYNKIWPSI